MTAYLAAHPYASATELAEVRAAERGQDPHQVPYFDLTVNQRLGVAPVADRILETRLAALRYVMVPRADGNGAEIGGVSQADRPVPPSVGRRGRAGRGLARARARRGERRTRRRCSGVA